MEAKNLLDFLNTAQKEAVLHTKGPLLIIAGAGAGKTRTIAHRIAHIVEEGVAPWNILAVTFTNKAAGEMRERVRALVPQGAGSPTITTFHALGARLLREFHAEAGVARTFVIWDRDDGVRALKRILGDKNMDSIAPKSVLSAISRAKSQCVTGTEYAERASSYFEQCVARAWHEYDKVMREEGALDFDDLVMRTLELLKCSPETLSRLQARWSHIHIDEYQDTDRVQFEIARLLAGDARNICVVGDLDQSIFTWRSARLENLLEFENEFPGTKLVTLEQNYRSTRTILTAANSIIEKNVRRKPKKLFTENAVGEAMTLYGAANDLEEAWFVAAEARGLIAEGVRPEEIAVLYRENFQSRALEEAFLHLEVPYRVIGTRFFERSEVKDVLSYLRAAQNPKSKNDLTRIVGRPARGIGKTTLEKMLAGQALPLAAQKKVDMFWKTLADIAHAIAILPTSEAVRFAFERSGLEALLKKDAEEGLERIENVRELVNFAARYDDTKPPEGIVRLLEEAALQSDQDELAEPRSAVSLMTVHASKGLEFDAVFVTGLEQGLFPAIRMNDADRDPEEERRLFYVALTRARTRVFLSYALERMRWGSRERTVPSEFLEDIDSRLLTHARLSPESFERVIR